MTRASGILLHPTSLPGRFGIGDLGPSAYAFVDALVAGTQRYWQILPLGPTGYGDSPYQTFSAFGGNPFLISPRKLADDGLLPRDALDEVPAFPSAEVDFGAVIPYKRGLLERAFVYFEEHASDEQRRDVSRFVEEQRAWLDDFALFMALKDAHGGRPWVEWEAAIAAREPEALDGSRRRYARDVRVHAYAQYLFFRQWGDLKRYANGRGIRIIGDAPIFVAHDSADCWARRDMFYLRPDGQPDLVAGVPPDYFSATGQLWGNPLYRWDAMAADGYRWWIARLRTTLDLVDVLRLDHFRGFAGYWAIPGDAPTAETGSWQPGPGAAFFAAVQEALGGMLPIIAEDLGVITPDVVALRERFGFPGMKVLQFAFGGDAANLDLPHNYERDYVVYTGTHDNDTTAGWFEAVSEEVRRHVRAYVGLPETSDANGDESMGSASTGNATRREMGEGTQAAVAALVRLAFASVADTAVVPLQDLLGLGTAARMNYPGQPGGNWRWRFSDDQLTSDVTAFLAALSRLYGRNQGNESDSRGDAER